eukprot:403344875
MKVYAKRQLINFQKVTLSKKGKRLCSQYADCYNCSFTYGNCKWDKNSQVCSDFKSTKYQNETAYKYEWIDMFDKCEDNLDLCYASDKIQSQKVLNKDQQYTFQMTLKSDNNLASLIPQNYFCNWTFAADLQAGYLLTIQRYSRYNLENLYLRLRSPDSVDNYTDANLAYGSSIVQYKILRINGMSIYARNNIGQGNSTFIITIQQISDDSSSGSAFGVISLVLFILMGVFIVICAAAIIRVCIRKRRISQVVENQIRLREMQDRSDQSRVSEEQQQKDRLNLLISLIKEKIFDRRMDEFKQNECVICFEDFQKGVKVRKIPTCRHLFHTTCIDGWFQSKIQEELHKCPLCNGEISIEKVKIAIKKRKEERKLREQQRNQNDKRVSIKPSKSHGNQIQLKMNFENQGNSLTNNILNNNIRSQQTAVNVGHQNTLEFARVNVVNYDTSNTLRIDNNNMQTSNSITMSRQSLTETSNNQLLINGPQQEQSVPRNELSQAPLSNV